MRSTLLLLPHPGAAASASAPSDLQAAPGIAVGVLLILAALGWFTWKGRWITKKVTLWLVIAAIAMIIICGYLGVDVEGVEP